MCHFRTEPLGAPHFVVDGFKFLVTVGTCEPLLSHRLSSFVRLDENWNPDEQFLFVASNVVITSSFEIGVWLAWAGATISLLGSSWTLPFGLLTTEVNRKKLGMILFPLGVVTAVFGTLIPLPVSIVLILTGLIVLGVSLILLLPRQRRTLAQILKSFGRGDKHDQSEIEEIG